FGWGVEGADVADCLPEAIDGADGPRSEVCFQLGESHLDRIEIGTVRWQEQHPCAARLDGGLSLWALVGSKVVKDDDVAFRQRRSELGLDIGFEDAPVHRPVDHEGCGQAEASQPGDEGLGLPVPEWRLRAQPLALDRKSTRLN